ncbi:heat shock protein-like protein 70 [Pseudovirgaria hyperparasitica]|uniref:Heat shock protein-like protein 70 n=1 Tax=Pseudovirgaria hyperparasitica TaxID=470096 RepID=A0A6A6W3R3_9PEZI|nr:heat shock protein-like protein 70 [Pseudovirgaria hyperparasitica]KAF2757578.1 heat shock protein-like protein 70 [Pseudovirgaria hyperparasitica]
MSDDESQSRVAIGISFGNSYSSIASTNNDGNTIVIANEDGDRQIPSMLSYVSGEEFHGQQAKSQLVRNPTNTVAYFRDFIGQDFKSIDPTPCSGSAHPKAGSDGATFNIKDTEEDSENTRTISEITTRHLKRLQTSASDYLGKGVNAAVITVPTNFTDKQKEALTASAKEAGIEVLQYIHEPVSAVLAYDARPDAKLSDKIVVVVDIGGIRTDVTVIASRGGLYSILATAHDYDVSGAQFDQALMDHFAKEFIKKHKTDPREDKRALAKLKLESEAVKKALSIGTNASFSVESLVSGIDFTSTINRTRFELIGNKYFASISRLALSAVEKAGLDPLDVSEIICSGGSSHTPKVARSLQSAFPEGIPVLAPATSPTSLNPSELAVRGAAIQASLISEFETEDIDQSTHPMVTAAPHLGKAIGILSISGDESSGVFRPLVEAHTPVPVRRTAQIAVPREGGDVLIKICEGVSQIKVSTPAPQPKAEKKDDEDEDSDEDDSEDEPEEVRERVWKAETVLSEAALRGVKKGAKVEVQLDVAADLSVRVTLRQVGDKGGKGLIGNIKGSAKENGHAS